MINHEEFAELMQALSLPVFPARMAVAVSGGADSMALALLAVRWAKERSIALTALTVDHGLRPESAKEAAQVKDWLAGRGIACETLSPQTPITGANIQEKARHARYRVMADWCKAHEAEHLLVAHHAGDQLETVLLRLIRAGGVEGLAAMRPASEMFGVTLLRPLLSVSKDALKATLREAGQAWIEDPSNASSAYTRNRLRPVAEALALEGLDAARVALLTSQLAATADYLNGQVEAWLAAHAVWKGESVTLPLDVWRDVPREIGWRALRGLIKGVGGGCKPPRSENLLPLLDTLTAGELTKPRTLGGCLLRPDAKKNTLTLTPEP